MEKNYGTMDRTMILWKNYDTTYIENYGTLIYSGKKLWYFGKTLWYYSKLQLTIVNYTLL